jgi:hypothetical protein
MNYSMCPVEPYLDVIFLVEIENSRYDHEVFRVVWL